MKLVLSTLYMLENHGSITLAHQLDTHWDRLRCQDDMYHKNCQPVDKYLCLVAIPWCSAQFSTKKIKANMAHRRDTCRDELRIQNHHQCVRNDPVDQLTP